MQVSFEELIDMVLPKMVNSEILPRENRIFRGQDVLLDQSLQAISYRGLLLGFYVLASHDPNEYFQELKSDESSVVIAVLLRLFKVGGCKVYV